MLTAMSVAREREQGTFDQLLVTPFRPAEIMAGKALPSMLVGIVQATGVLLVAQLWFRIPFAGLVPHALRGLVLFLLAAVGIGLLVSSLCRDHAAGDAVLLRADHAVRAAVGPDDAASATCRCLCNTSPSSIRCAMRSTSRSACIWRERVRACCMPDLWPLAVIAAVTLAAASWLFRAWRAARGSQRGSKRTPYT